MIKFFLAMFTAKAHTATLTNPRDTTRGPEILVCEPLDAAFPPKKPFTLPSQPDSGAGVSAAVRDVTEGFRSEFI